MKLTKEEIEYMKDCISVPNPFDSLEKAIEDMERINNDMSKLIEAKQQCQARINSLTDRDKMINRLTIWLEQQGELK